MTMTTSPTSWETALAELLTQLSAVQSELLAHLARKQALLVACDSEGLAALAADEERLIHRLQACHERRARLLAEAKEHGMPNDSIRSLAKTLPRAQRAALARQIEEAASRSRILRHHSLTNWVLIQRTLLHLAQLLEIIATGGRPQPTYGAAPAGCASGALVDQAA
jgi:flagellar biosynthesis/type III secretory pathway chaperone